MVYGDECNTDVIIDADDAMPSLAHEGVSMYIYAGHILDSVKPKGSNCLLFKFAVAVFWFCIAVFCHAKLKGSYCLLEKRAVAAFRLWRAVLAVVWKWQLVVSVHIVMSPCVTSQPMDTRRTRDADPVLF